MQRICVHPSCHVRARGEFSYAVSRRGFRLCGRISAPNLPFFPWDTHWARDGDGFYCSTSRWYRLTSRYFVHFLGSPLQKHFRLRLANLLDRKRVWRLVGGLAVSMLLRSCLGPAFGAYRVRKGRQGCS